MWTLVVAACDGLRYPLPYGDVLLVCTDELVDYTSIPLWVERKLASFKHIIVYFPLVRVPERVARKREMARRDIEAMNNTHVVNDTSPVARFTLHTDEETSSVSVCSTSVATDADDLTMTLRYARRSQEDSPRWSRGGAPPVGSVALRVVFSPRQESGCILGPTSTLYHHNGANAIPAVVVFDEYGVEVVRN